MGKLIRLELYNFKSYKGHHALLFGDSYFTSIIGPNGSGKSNSMDAISFVLGIKSSHLRSTHLRDLVYRGRILKTSKINADGSASEPNAAAAGDMNGHEEDGALDDDANANRSSQRNDPQSAWVMAVYEDDAGEEQTWKRSITTQGQSEYRINNRVVNAKQYNEALEAENILIKARNFLVFQGDVESIANQSPKDLTRLVEQISGSLEYKAEYDRLAEESEKAIEDQTFKLTQRRGINAEIKQFAELKREADNYVQKADERDDAVVTHVLWKLYHFQRVIEESGEEIKRHQDELKEHRRGIELYEQRLDEAKREQARVNREVGKIDRNIKAAEKDVEDKQHELVPIDEKVALTKKSLEKYKTRVAEVSKERDAQSKGVEQLRKDLDVVQKAQAKWEDDFKKLAKKEGRQLKDSDVQEYNRLKAEVNKRTADAQIKVDNLTRQRKTDEETVKSLKGKTEELEKQVGKLQSDVTETNERKDNSDATGKQLAQEIEVKKKEYNAVTSERLKAAQKHTELDEKLQEVLRKLLEADDGRRQSDKDIKARETLQAMKRLFSGVRGRVHELCKPKQKKFETAVARVLGRDFDSIVVETEKVAQECIAYLRDQRLGQATFLPLDTIQVKAPNPSLKGMHKKMRLGIDSVEYDNSVERAITHVFGNAMVCDDLETAKYLVYEKRVDAKAVTLDGNVIHKTGLMAGGRGANDKTGRKWEETEVENLRRVKDKLLADIAALPSGRKTVATEESLQSELAGLEQRLATANEESKTLQKNVESKKKELKFTQKQLSEVKPRYQDSSQAMESLLKRIQNHENEVSQVEDGVFNAFCQRLNYDNIRTYEAQQGNLQQEGAQKRLEFSMQKSKLDNQLRFEAQRLQSTKDRIKNLEDQAHRDSDLIAALEAEKEAIQTQLAKIEAQITKHEDSLAKQRQLQNEKADKVAEERRELQKRNKDVDSVSKAISGLEAEIQRNSSGRYALLRKCKIEEVKVPLTDDSEPLSSLPADDLLQDEERDPDAMDVDQDPNVSTIASVPARDYGIEVEFDELDDDLKEDSSAEQEATLQAAISSLTAELGSLNPNMRAVDRLNTAQERLKASEDTFRAAQRAAKRAQDDFEHVREQRAELFNQAFNHISSKIGPVYKALTQTASFPLGGQAYLDTMGADEETPFLGGLKYHAMPPLKRFRDMDALSGGEKTIAALALLFAIHSYAPSPFFVLDEVDAALDNANVAKVARYIRENAGPGMQFIVISLKTGLFQESECLVGILRDQGLNTSRAVTLDLRKYQPT